MCEHKKAVFVEPYYYCYICWKMFESLNEFFAQRLEVVKD